MSLQTLSKLISLQVYDYFLTLSREVELIWPSNWNFVKYLFFLTRYLPFLDVSVVLYCTSRALANNAF